MRWLVLAVLLAAPAPAMAQDAERGGRLFVDNCAVCHGADGRGDGPMADILVIPPPDLTRIAARYGGEFPRIGIARIVDGRDAILSHGGDMPIFGNIFSAQSEVLRSQAGRTLLTSPEIVDLVAWLEEVQE